LPSKKTTLRVLFKIDNTQHTIILKYPKILVGLTKIEKECIKHKYSCIKSLTEVRTFSKYTKEMIYIIIDILKNGILMKDKGTNLYVKETLMKKIVDIIHYIHSTIVI